MIRTNRIADLLRREPASADGDSRYLAKLAPGVPSPSPKAWVDCRYSIDDALGWKPLLLASKLGEWGF